MTGLRRAEVVKRLLAIACSLALTSVVSGARAARIEDITSGKNVEPLSRTYRVDLATLMSSRLRDLRACVPAPTPDEVAWLSNERARIKGIADEGLRLMQFVELGKTKVCAMTELAEQLDDVVMYLDRIVRSDKFEMTNWAHVAVLLGDSSVTDPAKVLVEKYGFVLPKIDGLMSLESQSDRMWALDLKLAWWSRGILEHLLVLNIGAMELERWQSHAR